MVQSIDDPPDLDFSPPEMVLQDMEEQAKVAEVVPSCKGLELTEVALPVSSVEEVPLEVKASSNPRSLKVCESNDSLGGNGRPPGPTSSTLLDEFLNNFSCTAPLSLLDAPIHVQFEGESTCATRRSGRLDKKNKNCSIPIAKRAEYRLAEAFGELPKDAFSKKGSEEDVQEKMKPYLQMCKQPVSSMALQAIHELVQVNG